MKHSTCACYLLFALLVGAGCSRVDNRENDANVVDVEEVKSLLESGQVEIVCQWHNGPVELKLRDGRELEFYQPRIDWITSYIRDNDLNDKIDLVLVE